MNSCRSASGHITVGLLFELVQFVTTFVIAMTDLDYVNGRNKMTAADCYAAGRSGKAAEMDVRAFSGFGAEKASPH